MEIEPKISPQVRRIKSDTPPQNMLFQSKGGTRTRLKPDVDVILSLKNDFYKSIMDTLFRRLGEKTKANEGNDDEKDAAREAIRLFMNRKVGEQGVRFFKAETRYSSKSYVEVDEAAASEKITADVYRRMESAKRWMKSDEIADDEGDSTPKNTPLPQAPREKSQPTRSTVLPAQSAAPIPVQQSSTNPRPAKSTRKNKKRKLLRKVPESLPFLTDTKVADIIAEEELRAKGQADGLKSLSYLEVVNFFRGVFVHGWNEWKKVSNTVKTRQALNLKSYAMKLEKKFPELIRFFSSKQVNDTQGKQVKRLIGNGGTKESGGAAKQMILPQDNDPAMIAASVMGAMKHTAAKGHAKPKVVICLGDHIIDTEAEPSLIQPSRNRKRPADTLPDYFDPSIRPSVPTNQQQIFIPGNKVYARWLNKADPGSYGTWYPGFINASKISPIQDEHEVPNLLYHVMFDDGAESLDLDTEDIMMHDQYRSWLKDLEQYYALPVTQEMTWKRLAKNTQVFAKWIDPTDPELDGSWMSGKVHSSKTWEGDESRWHNSYHIYFDNGDQDENLLDGDVLEEEAYREALREKMERGVKTTRLSGFDLITEASKITSPITTALPLTNEHDTFIGGSAERLYSEDSDASDDASFVEKLCCNEVLETSLPSPTPSVRLSSTPSPDVHYGIYMKAKSWEASKKQSLPQQGQHDYSLKSAALISPRNKNSLALAKLTLPAGKTEHTISCPNIGEGWTQHLVARKGMNANDRIDRYFYSPGKGKRFRSMAEVTRFLLQEQIPNQEAAELLKKGWVWDQSKSPNSTDVSHMDIELKDLGSNSIAASSSNTPSKLNPSEEAGYGFAKDSQTLLVDPHTTKANGGTGLQAEALSDTTKTDTAAADIAEKLNSTSRKSSTVSILPAPLAGHMPEVIDSRQLIVRNNISAVMFDRPNIFAKDSQEVQADPQIAEAQNISHIAKATTAPVLAQKCNSAANQTSTVNTVTASLVEHGGPVSDSSQHGTNSAPMPSATGLNNSQKTQDLSKDSFREDAMAEV